MPIFLQNNYPQASYFISSYDGAVTELLQNENNRA